MNAAAAALTPAPVEYEVVETLMLDGRRWARGGRVDAEVFAPGRAEALLRIGKIRDPADVRVYRAERPFCADGVQYDAGQVLPPEAAGWRSLQVMLRVGRVRDVTDEVRAMALTPVVVTAREQASTMVRVKRKGKKKAASRRAG